MSPKNPYSWKPDAIGLKIGVVYDTLFRSKNESTIAIQAMDNDELSWEGGKLLFPTVNSNSSSYNCVCPS